MRAISRSEPIIHNHGNNVKAAEVHCLALSKGGWCAKLVRPAGQGWQVVITGFRGFGCN